MSAILAAFVISATCLRRSSEIDVLGREVVVDVDAELALAGVLGQVADVAVGGEDAVVGAQVALDRPRLGRRLDDHEVLRHGRECSTGSCTPSASGNRSGGLARASGEARRGGRARASRRAPGRESARGGPSASRRRPTFRRPVGRRPGASRRSQPRAAGRIGQAAGADSDRCRRRPGRSRAVVGDDERTARSASTETAIVTRRRGGVRTALSSATWADPPRRPLDRRRRPVPCPLDVDLDRQAGCPPRSARRGPRAPRRARTPRGRPASGRPSAAPARGRPSAGGGPGRRDRRPPRPRRSPAEARQDDRVEVAGETRPLGGCGRVSSRSRLARDELAQRRHADRARTRSAARAACVPRRSSARSSARAAAGPDVADDPERGDRSSDEVEE